MLPLATLWWRSVLRWLPSALRRPLRTPFTFGYVAVLGVTTLVLRAAGSHTATALLTASSTDVSHLHREPLRVLVSSALWLPSLNWLLYAALFGLVLAPVERRAGWRWVLGIFTSGHVLATLFTELPIAWAVGHGYLSAHAEHRLDVGVSYGFYATVGAFVGLLPTVARRFAAVVALALVVVPALVSNDSLTALGHVTALLVGIAWWPWLWRRGLDGSLFCRRRAPAAPQPQRTAP